MAGTWAAGTGSVNELQTHRVDSAVRALVLCLDAGTINLLGEVLQAMGVAMDTCVDAQAAIRRLGRERLDALFVDWSSADGAREVLNFVRNSPVSRTIVVFAITPTHAEAEDAFHRGAHFVLDFPVTKPRLISALRAAYGLMLRERRRYFRYPASFRVFVAGAASAEVETLTLDISERGMAIVPPEGVTTGAELGLRFQLPGNAEWLRVKAQICWVDARKRAGLQFTAIPKIVLEHLQEWIARRLEQATTVAVRTQTQPRNAAAESGTGQNARESV